LFFLLLLFSSSTKLKKKAEQVLEVRGVGRRDRGWKARVRNGPAMYEYVNK
jgi:hypothetical protein